MLEAHPTTEVGVPSPMRAFSPLGALRSRVSARIALRLVPAFVGIVLLVGLIATGRESELLAQEIQRDADNVALAVAGMLEIAGVSPQVAAGWVFDVNNEVPGTLIEWVPAEHPLPDQAQPGEMRGVAPVRDRAGTLLGWVVVREPLSERDAFLGRWLVAGGVALSLSTVAATLFATAIGRSLVGRRIQLLTERLEAVGRGDVDTSPLALGEDEIGQLGLATDAMTAALRAARARADSEAARSRAAQLQLRRADRLAVVGRTVAVFAHEIGTPLGVIVGRAQKLEGLADPAQARNARIVREQAERITSFVRRVLDYARHDDGFEPRVVDLDEVVQRAASLVGDRAERRGVGLRVDPCAQPARLLGDPKGLEQVVTNLLSNAVDASPPGQAVHVAVLRAACGVGVGRGLGAEHLHIQVDDAGPGVPPDLRERVFDPFYTSKPAGEGTGLGLSVVMEIVQDHGGAVSLEDGPGGGCRAVVHLPDAGSPL